MYRLHWFASFLAITFFKAGSISGGAREAHLVMDIEVPQTERFSVSQPFSVFLPSCMQHRGVLAYQLGQGGEIYWYLSWCHEA